MGEKHAEGAAGPTHTDTQGRPQRKNPTAPNTHTHTCAADGLCARGASGATARGAAAAFGALSRAYQPRCPAGAPPSRVANSAPMRAASPKSKPVPAVGAPDTKQ